LIAPSVIVVVGVDADSSPTGAFARLESATTELRVYLRADLSHAYLSLVLCDHPGKEIVLNELLQASTLGAR